MAIANVWTRSRAMAFASSVTRRPIACTYTNPSTSPSSHGVERRVAVHSSGAGGGVDGDHHHRPPFPITASERSNPLVGGRWDELYQRWDEHFRRWNKSEYGKGLPVVGVPVSAPLLSRAMEYSNEAGGLDSRCYPPPNRAME